MVYSESPQVQSEGENDVVCGLYFVVLLLLQLNRQVLGGLVNLDLFYGLDYFLALGTLPLVGLIQ